MPTLISVEEFLERFDINGDVEHKRIKPHIGAASRRLRKWIGETNYENALSENGEFEELQDDLKNAEAHLTFHYAILGLNYPLSSKGIVATSASSEGKELRKYLTPDETAKVELQFLEKSREIAEPYIADDWATVETVSDDC